ncbi:MAG: hypothetical protein IKS37_12080 [Solobacterium sp.]|nr:hypothetical protein [Solobacterium sp.]
MTQHWKQTMKSSAEEHCIKLVLCGILLLAAGCSSASELKSFADSYTAADKETQVVIRNKGNQKTQPETMMSEEQIEEERKKEEPWTLGYPYCTVEAIDQGIPNYYAFETGYRKELLQKITDAKAEKIDAFTGDAAKEYIAFETGSDRLTVYQDGKVILNYKGNKSYYQLPDTIVSDLDAAYRNAWDTYYTAEKKPCWVIVDADGNRVVPE